MENQKKRSFPLFWILYALFVLAMVIFWICVIRYVKRSLLVYEASQPGQKMESIMEELRQTGLSSYVTCKGEVSRFETEQSYVGEFMERTEGAILFYTQDKANYDVSAPKYELYANGDPVGYVTLREVSSKPLMGILSLSEWELGDVELICAEAKHTVRITVPEDYQVLLNGIPMEESEVTAREVSEEFRYASEYVPVPAFVTYEAEGLLKAPQVDILDGEGTPVTAVPTIQGDRTELVLRDFAETEMPEDLKAMALEHAERYTNFFSTDLEGCRQSVRPIKDMFPENSYYLQLADTYRREDMWTYSDHSTPVFSEEEVSHYISYSPELFSCEIFFNKTMVLTKTGSRRVDTTHSRVYYGLLDGEWKILDIKTL